MLSQRVEALGESETLKMARLASELKMQGKDIVSLSLGEPDFHTPDFIKAAAKKAIDNNFSFYSPVAGFLETRKAICKKLLRDNQLNYTPDQIVISTGAKQSIMNVVLGLVNPGDEVIIPAPYWVSYIEMVRFAGGIPVVIETDIESDFKITAAQLSNAITSKTKLFIFSNPSNPTGSQYNKVELDQLVNVFKQNPHVQIISDEIYELICYEEKNISLATYSEIYSQVITVNGVSKGFAMTGWRLGYIAASKEIAAACNKIQGQFTSGTSSITQIATIDAFEADPAVVKHMQETFKERRDYMVAELSQINGLKVNNPPGAFYIFPDISAFLGKEINGHKITSSQDFSMLLLSEDLLATTPGDAFGAPKNIRLSYAASTGDLQKAVERMRSFISKIN